VRGGSLHLQELKTDVRNHLNNRNLSHFLMIFIATQTFHVILHAMIMGSSEKLKN